VFPSVVMKKFPLNRNIMVTRAHYLHRRQIRWSCARLVRCLEFDISYYDRKKYLNARSFR